MDLSPMLDCYSVLHQERAPSGKPCSGMALVTGRKTSEEPGLDGHGQVGIICLGK